MNERYRKKTAGILSVCFFCLFACSIFFFNLERGATKSSRERERAKINIVAAFAVVDR